MQNKSSILKWIKRFLSGLIFLSFVLFVGRILYLFYEDKIDADLEKIKRSELGVQTVMKENLAPILDFSKTHADLEIPETFLKKDQLSLKGIDANQNGIRDTVEINIFKKYPDSAKVRAPLLQFAQALQLEQEVETKDEKVVTEVVLKQEKAIKCIGDTLVPRKVPDLGREDEEMEQIDAYINFVRGLQYDTKERVEARKIFLTKLRGFINYAEINCDISSDNLSN